MARAPRPTPSGRPILAARFTPPSLLGAVDHLTNAVGTPLGADARARLAAFLADPRPSTWHAVHSLIVNTRMTTVWQAWRATCADAPLSGRVYAGDTVLTEWARIPTLDELAAALDYAVRHGHRQP